ncbi:MAG: DinB family protein [Flavobacteriales bacterium]
METVDLLRETPVALANMVKELDKSLLVAKPDSKWSIQEHVGHLLTIESLWIAHFDDFVLEKPFLRPWNGTNADTDAGQFNLQGISQILDDFASIRNAHMNLIDKYLPKQDEMTCHHQSKGIDLTLRAHLEMMLKHDQDHLEIILKRLA